MKLRDEFNEDDQAPEEWIYLWRNDRNHPLTRFCILVTILGLTGWFLIQALTP